MHVSYNGPIVRFSGYNPATNTTEENVSELSSLITYASLGAAAKLQVSSSAAADDGDPAGTGAQTIEIVGLDSAYALQTETVTLNGQTQVETTKSFLRVFHVTVLTAGSGYTNAGDLYIIKTGTGGTVTAGVPGTLTSAWVKVPVGQGYGTSGIFTVPAGKKYQLRSIIASGYKQASEVRLYTHNPTRTVENALKCVLTYGVSTGMVQLNVPPMLDPTALYLAKFSEKTDLYLRCLSATADGVVSAIAILEEYFGDR